VAACTYARGVSLHRSLSTLVAGVAVAAGLAGCGGSEAAGEPPARPPDLTVVAVPGYRFDQAAYAAAAGKVLVSYRNDDQQSHSLVVRRPDGDVVRGFRILIAPGLEQASEVRLAPGTYRLVCDVPGHEASGQVAELTVT
jgi:hypothetical protein